MITLIIALFSVIAYLFFGWVAALRNLPRAWAEAREHASYDMTGSARARTLLMFLFWPFYIPGRAIGTVFFHVVDAGDPEVVAKKMREQQKRIDQLERDLGIR